MLLFNVTCIGRAEEVNLAQLHLHRRRLRRSSSPSHRSRILAPPCKVKLFQVLPSKGKQRARFVPLASLPVPESIRGGWHSLDVTAVLREVLLGGPTSSLQLGVRFEAPRNRPITPEHFLKMSNETSAFLVAFSEDTPDNSVLAGGRNPLRHTHAIATMIKHSGGSDVGTDEDLQSSDELAMKSRKQHPRQSELDTTHGDLYLESDNIIEEESIETETEDDSRINDFTFESEERLKYKEGSLKKISAKAKGKKVAKGILDSLDDERKDSVRRVQKQKVKDDMINYVDEEIKDNVVSDKGKKNGLVPEKDAWLIHGNESANKGALKRRRMHPKTRFRVREWRGDMITATNKDKADRLLKFIDESPSLSSTQSHTSNENDESFVSEEKKLSKRNVRSAYKDENASLQSSDKNRGEFFHTVENAIDVEGIENNDGDVEMKVKRTEEREEDPNNLGRNSRSIHDNELPDSQGSSNREIPKTSPETILETRVTQETARTSAHVIPYPGPSSRRWRGEGRRRRGRGKKRDGKKKGKNAKKGFESWQLSGEQFKSGEDRVVDSPSCHRKKLQVDFADIGWSDWIISPPQFEAYYCAGRCAYPLAKVVKPTNHATLQSLISAIGHQPEVPEPCCVPDKLSSTSLLYFDDNQNVVLKNYPDMSVESCACR